MLACQAQRTLGGQGRLLSALKGDSLSAGKTELYVRSLQNGEQHKGRVQAAVSRCGLDFSWFRGQGKPSEEVAQTGGVSRAKGGRRVLSKGSSILESRARGLS